MIKSIFKWFAILIVCTVLVVSAGVGYAWYDREQRRAVNREERAAASAQRVQANVALVEAAKQEQAAAKQDATKQEQAAAIAAAVEEALQAERTKQAVAAMQCVPAELRGVWWQRVADPFKPHTMWEEEKMFTIGPNSVAWVTEGQVGIVVACTAITDGYELKFERGAITRLVRSHKYKGQWENRVWDARGVYVGVILVAKR